MKLNTDNKKDADEKLAASESVSDSAQAEQGGAQAEAAVKTKKKPEKKKKKAEAEKNDTRDEAAETAEKPKKNIPIITPLCGFFMNNALFLTFVISLVVNSLILRAFTVKFGESKAGADVFMAIVKPMLADVVAVTIIGLFGFLFRKQSGRFKYLMIWTVVFSILGMGNSIYYTNYKSFLSVSLLSTASQLGGVMDAVTKNIMEAKDFILLWPILAMIAVYILIKKTHEPGYVKQKQPRAALARYAGSA